MAEAVLIGNHGEHALQPFVREFDHPSAAYADEMLVMFLARRPLEPPEALAELVGPDEARLHEEIQRAVDRRRADPFAARPELRRDGAGGFVPVGAEHELGDEVPRMGHREPLLPEPAPEALEKPATLRAIGERPPRPQRTSWQHPPRPADPRR